MAGASPVTLKDLRVWGFFAAIFIYAVFGTPTPERAGEAEILIGLLLAAAVGLPGGWQAFSFREGAPWQAAGRLLLVYGLTVPLITGLAAGNSIAGISRDMIPFLFLLLPLFLFPLFEGRARDLKVLTGIVVVLGLVFAGRVGLPYFSGQEVADPFRLANAPTVLFAALLLTGLCGLSLYHGKLVRSVVFFGLAFVPLAAMALITQRASIGVFCLTVLVLLLTGLVRRPKRAALPLFLLVFAAAAYWPLIAEVVEGLMQKHTAVGLNMRWQEAEAVMDALGGSMFAVLFGKGWGASFVSPAVGGTVVNFTHSLITTYWLKTGLAGLVLALLYLYRFGRMLLRLLPAHQVIALALAGPFFIDILLYASFKSLDFGLLLLLIPLWHGALTEPDRQPRRLSC